MNVLNSIANCYGGHKVDDETSKADFEFTYDPLVLRLKTPEECEIFTKNVEKSHPDLAKQARRRGVELRAAAAGAETKAEVDALKAVHAYEEVRRQQTGKKFRANRTW